MATTPRARYNVVMTGDPSSTDAAALSSKPRKRRWLQFSLRSLLIFTLVCAIGAAWLGRQMEKKRREREAVQMILEGGGTVNYDYQFDASGKRINGAEPRGPTWLRGLLGENFFTDVEFISLKNSPNCRAVLAGSIEEFTRLRRLSLLGTEVTDADIDRLQGMSKLKSLWLSGNGITDVSLAQLSAFPELSELSISKTAVTDEGMATLAKYPQIESLYVEGTSIGDKGVANLRPLKNLRHLNLANTKITNVAIGHLESCTKLESLILDDTKVTNDALALLKGHDNLQTLSVNRTAVNDAGLEYLTSLPKLRNLNLYDTRVTETGFPWLAKLNSLRNLDLGPRGRRDPVFERISELGKVPLVLRPARYSNKAVAELQKALLQCRIRY